MQPQRDPSTGRKGGREWNSYWRVRGSIFIIPVCRIQQFESLQGLFMLQEGGVDGLVKRCEK